MKKIAFKNKKFKWVIVFILLLLIAYNLYTLINENFFPYVRILFLIVILILIFTKNRYAKDFIEISSFLYAILIGFNLLVIVIPLILHLMEPLESIGNEIYISLIEASIKLILAILVYKLSTKQISIVSTKSN